MEDKTKFMKKMKNNTKIAFVKIALIDMFYKEHREKELIEFYCSYKNTIKPTNFTDSEYFEQKMINDKGFLRNIVRNVNFDELITM